MKTIASFKNTFLSNFAWSEPRPSVEHHYQAAKAIKVEDKERILNAKTGAEAKTIAKTIQIREDWETYKFEVMESLLRIKFNEQSMKKLLLKTEDAELIEGNYWHDNVWGICTCTRCQNRRWPESNQLGKMLMKIREELKKGD
jgi:ribA/ribD-fused uncharacterized protein